MEKTTQAKSALDNTFFRLKFNIEVRWLWTKKEDDAIFPPFYDIKRHFLDSNFRLMNVRKRKSHLVWKNAKELQFHMVPAAYVGNGRVPRYEPSKWKEITP